MSRIIFFYFFTEWVVGTTLLQIGLKRLSMRVTLDLLHEFANTEVFGLFHNCMWQSRHSEVDVYFLTLCEQINWLLTANGSHRSNLICVHIFVCVLDFIWTFNRHTLVLSQPSKKRLSISWALELDGCSVETGRPVLTDNWICGLWLGLGLLGVFTMSRNFRTQFLHPTVFKGNLLRRPGWRKYFLVYDFSSSHLDTIGWECFVNFDGVRSRLTEL